MYITFKNITNHINTTTNNITENNTPYENNTITNKINHTSYKIINKEIKPIQSNKPKHVHVNNETGNPIIILFIALFAIGIMKK